MKLSDGAELWTTSSGSGPAVVTLHGGSGLWDYLDPITSMIGGSHTVIRFDQRGCGWSSPSSCASSEALNAVHIRALGGAELALLHAAAHSERTTGVTYLAGVEAGNWQFPAGALPNAHRIVIDDAGHTPWRERPDEVAAALADPMRFSV